MEKIKGSIYRYDGKLESDKTSLVLVHPWYEEFGNRFKIFKELESTSNSLFSSESYKNNLANLLNNSSDRNIFLFEENVMAEESCKRIYNMTGRSRGIYAIKTKEGSPSPFEDSWENVMNFMEQFSNDVDIAGGYVNNFKIEGNPPSVIRAYSACAGTVYEEFKKRGFKPSLVEGCCFC